VTWTEPAAFYVKLHLGDPGSAGTANAASETTRQAVTFSAASAGAITNSADIDWTAVAATESVTHISFWDASTAGTFLGSDALNATASLSSGGDFTIAAGDLDISLTPIAA
jgi:hypothetical protein